MRHPYCVLVLALAVGAPSTASATLITQSIGVRAAEHASIFPSYNQFNPALGTLTGVTLEFTNGQATTSTFTFQNNNGFQVTSTDKISFTFFIGDQTKSVSGDFLDTLPAFGRVEHTVSGGFSGSTSYTTGLSRFVGTGFLSPDVFPGGTRGGTATATASGVVSSLFAPFYTISFTEKITYTYLTPAEAAALAAPEPAGVALAASGLLASACVRLGRRWRMRWVRV